jgi:hypothetical protein
MTRQSELERAEDGRCVGVLKRGFRAQTKGARGFLGTRFFRGRAARFFRLRAPLFRELVVYKRATERRLVPRAGRRAAARAEEEARVARRIERFRTEQAVSAPGAAAERVSTQTLSRRSLARRSVSLRSTRASTGRRRSTASLTAAGEGGGAASPAGGGGAGGSPGGGTSGRWDDGDGAEALGDDAKVKGSILLEDIVFVHAGRNGRDLYIKTRERTWTVAFSSGELRRDVKRGLEARAARISRAVSKFHAVPRYDGAWFDDVNDHGEVYYWHMEANITTYDKPPEFPEHDPECPWVRLLHRPESDGAAFYDYKNPAASVFFSNELHGVVDGAGIGGADLVAPETVWAADWEPALGFRRTEHRWEEHYDPTRGRVFYVHASSRQVSWHPPPSASDDFFFLHHLLEAKKRMVGKRAVERLAKSGLSK